MLNSWNKVYIYVQPILLVMNELTKIKNSVKKDLPVKNEYIDKAIELTYEKITKQFIKNLKKLSET